MPERIYKLQPDRTIHLRGFDGFGAAAALHTATASSFELSGVFRDSADFAVLVLFDADNFFEHPRLKYLPDMNFNGLTLTFDMTSTGLMPIDSPKYATIDWPYLDVIREDGTTAQIRLFDHAQQVGGAYTRAEGRFTILDGGLKEFDRLTIWYLNYAFDYFVPKLECGWQFFAAGVGTLHSVTAEGQAYSYIEAAGDSSAVIASALAQLLAASAVVIATPGDGTPENGPTHQLNLRARPGVGEAVVVSSSADATPITLYRVSASSVAAALAVEINGVNWQQQGVILPLEASTSDDDLVIRCSRPGEDGNSISLYAVSKNNRLCTAQSLLALSGGSSAATWRISLDFAALGVASIRKMWLTFAPGLPPGAAYTATEWQAVFENWTVAGPEEVKALSVAGPCSLRIEETDALCLYSGNWTSEEGFYSGGYAKRASTLGDAVTISYYAAFPHDIWIGTSLAREGGVAGVSLDGDGETDLNTCCDTDEAVITRRRARASVAAGPHRVTIRLKTGPYFYFDFLEAAVAGDVPDAYPSRAEMCPALDYSTDHTYKLPPARILWGLDKLGLRGPLNEYIGVFWWNQRCRNGGLIPAATSHSAAVSLPATRSS